MFEPKLVEDEEDVVKVTVNNNENGTKYTWPLEKASDRKFIFEELREEYNATGALPISMKDPKTDPFW